MFDEKMLSPYLLYSKPIPYKDKIVVYPITMDNILEFRLFQKCLTIRKNSWFPDKTIIKMSYLNFLMFCANNPDYLKRFNNEDDSFDDAGNYYLYFYLLLKMACKDNNVEIGNNGHIIIDDTEVDDVIFDDLRRILIIQNGIDFNIDEFINYTTERALRKAKEHLNKNVDMATIEDYIDSLMVALNFSEDQVRNLPIRKFWRLIERINMHESYTICKTGESSGFVTYKEPIKHWMTSKNVDDEFGDVKIDDKSLKNKIG